MRFLKGHGTENDFVLLPDLDGSLDLTPGLVAALCDRRAGIGADGVLRVVRSKAAGDPAAEAQSSDAEWFMDYRNSDGSAAEMCGNGIRVFARYLVDAGLAAPGEFPIATRAGLRQVTLGPTGDVSVDMGPPQLLGESTATLAGHTYPGQHVTVGNPHLACQITAPVETLDFYHPPSFDHAVFPEGVNVEFYRPLAEGHVEMRVYERGAAETRSCGTGTVAVAAAAARATGIGEWTIDIPGGRVTVTLDTKTSHLRGPAVLLAQGDVDPRHLTYRDVKPMSS